MWQLRFHMASRISVCCVMFVGAKVLSNDISISCHLSTAHVGARVRVLAPHYAVPSATGVCVGGGGRFHAPAPHLGSWIAHSSSKEFKLWVVLRIHRSASQGYKVGESLVRPRAKLRKKCALQRNSERCRLDGCGRRVRDDVMEEKLLNEYLSTVKAMVSQEKALTAALGWPWMTSLQVVGGPWTLWTGARRLARGLGPGLQLHEELLDHEWHQYGRQGRDHGMVRLLIIQYIIPHKGENCVLGHHSPWPASSHCNFSCRSGSWMSPGWCRPCSRARKCATPRRATCALPRRRSRLKWCQMRKHHCHRLQSQLEAHFTAVSLWGRHF